MKSIWIEKQHIDKSFMQLFSDCGVPDDHIIFERASETPKEELVQAIKEASQICFVSSFTVSSIDFLEPIMQLFLKAGLTGKHIYCTGEFTHSLNVNYNYDTDDTGIYAPIFASNEIYELTEGVFRRIRFDASADGRKRFYLGEKLAVPKRIFIELDSKADKPSGYCFDMVFTNSGTKVGEVWDAIGKADQIYFSSALHPNSMVPISGGELFNMIMEKAEATGLHGKMVFIDRPFDSIQWQNVDVGLLAKTFASRNHLYTREDIGHWKQVHCSL